jgi:hypothetical protein
MTELSADKLYEDANELVLNDQFEKALNVLKKFIYLIIKDVVLNLFILIFKSCILIR